MKWLKFLLLTILFLAAVLFSMRNMDPVTLRFGLLPLQEQTWFETPEIPLFLAILLSIFLGILIGGSADIYHRLQLKRTLRQNQRTIERLEKEIQSLRSTTQNIPSQEWSNQDVERK